MSVLLHKNHASAVAPAPPKTFARGRKLPYFAQNFSPPPPYGLPEPCAASVSVFAERNGTTREDKSMTHLVDDLFANQLKPAPDVLTTEEVARLLRVDTSTVIRWATQHTLKCVQVGPRLHRFPKWCLEEFLSDTAKNTQHK